MVVGDGQWSLVVVRIDGWLVEVVGHDCRLYINAYIKLDRTYSIC